METIAINKRNAFYIANQLVFKIHIIRKWILGKESYHLIDAFGNTQLIFYLKHGFGFSKIVFIENNLSSSYEFVQNKNSFCWIYNGHK
ncbi:hypothetical protein [Paenimyroides aestuarii]|uniref:Uncharacterized protein n=1 Tax=Paenimyroides aestuarii TaxID=2968490 RepID=A0ABY5NVE9_9FLAO|nr:hypothetical protein [Paenimyroides aestuarii]UUV22515.1 hypothetical protein NPX36_05600 [Paenimyroides aestuarii]